MFIVTAIEVDTKIFFSSPNLPMSGKRCRHVISRTEIRAVHQVLDVLFVLPTKCSTVVCCGRFLCRLPEGARVVGLLYDMVRYDIFVNCNWVDTRWQWYSTHLHTDSTQNDTVTQNTQNGTYIAIRIHKHDIKNT